MSSAGPSALATKVPRQPLAAAASRVFQLLLLEEQGLPAAACPLLSSLRERCLQLCCSCWQGEFSLPGIKTKELLQTKTRVFR